MLSSSSIKNHSHHIALVVENRNHLPDLESFSESVRLSIVHFVCLLVPQDQFYVIVIAGGG
jgi:hypothetical protein